MPVDLSTLSTADVLVLYADVIEELRTREVTRSSNNPIADYTEHLVCAALGLTRTPRSASGHDGVDDKGARYQIKSRRPTQHNRSTLLGALRNLPLQPFDFLVGVVYRPDFTVDYAGVVPHAVVMEMARFSTHTHAHRFHMRRSVLSDPRVVDITSRLGGKASKERQQ